MVEKKEFKADDIGPGGGEIEFLNPDGDALENDAPASFKILKQDGSLLKKATLDDSNVIDLEDVTERQIKLVFDPSGDTSEEESSGEKSEGEEDSGEDESSDSESDEGGDADSEGSDEADTGGEGDEDSEKSDSGSSDGDEGAGEAGEDDSSGEKG